MKMLENLFSFNYLIFNGFNNSLIKWSYIILISFRYVNKFENLFLFNYLMFKGFNYLIMKLYI